jgi:hypothetical protein
MAHVLVEVGLALGLGLVVMLVLRDLRGVFGCDRRMGRQ